MVWTSGSSRIAWVGWSMSLVGTRTAMVPGVAVGSVAQTVVVPVPADYVV